jgi:hypothetical protein
MPHNPSSSQPLEAGSSEQQQLADDSRSSVSRSLPHTVSSPLLLLMSRTESSSTNTAEELTIENSLIGSRVPLIPRSISGKRYVGIEYRYQ